MLIYLLFISLFVTPDKGVIHSIDYYLKHPKVSKAAKDFYYKKFNASDDNRTFSIFDSLNTKNSDTKPFYIFLCSKIIEKSDGALGEAAGVYAREFVEKTPQDFIFFFTAKNVLLDSDKYFKIWAKAVAYELQLIVKEKRKFA